MAYEYTEKELQMFKLLDLDLNEVMMRTIPPIQVYNLVARNCFVNRIEGKAAESLRRCLKAFDSNDSICRNTKAFDELIEL